MVPKRANRSFYSYTSQSCVSQDSLNQKRKSIKSLPHMKSPMPKAKIGISIDSIPQQDEREARDHQAIELIETILKKAVEGDDA